MKTVLVSLGFIAVLVAAGAIGLFASQPGLTLVSICALPIATLALGFAAGRAGLRVIASSSSDSYGL